MAETIERFPLFPLGLVLIPHELVPLHIFEERYKLMIGQCLDQDSEFGIVWLSDDGLKEIGCSARALRRSRTRSTSHTTMTTDSNTHSPMRSASQPQPSGSKPNAASAFGRIATPQAMPTHCPASLRRALASSWLTLLIVPEPQAG